jgi:hypothetical protein
VYNNIVLFKSSEKEKCLRPATSPDLTPPILKWSNKNNSKSIFHALLTLDNQTASKQLKLLFFRAPRGTLTRPINTPVTRSPSFSIITVNRQFIMTDKSDAPLYNLDSRKTTTTIHRLRHTSFTSLPPITLLDRLLKLFIDPVRDRDD